jgi:hypothetical protein
MMPHPVPQKRHAALSQRHLDCAWFDAASTLEGTAIPIAVAADAAALFKNSLLSNDIEASLMKSRLIHSVKLADSLRFPYAMK